MNKAKSIITAGFLPVATMKSLLNSPNTGIRWLVLAIGFGLTACSPHTAPAPGIDREPRHFTGTLTATGTRQTLPFEANRQAAIFKLTGSLLLKGTERPNLGFKVDILGFSDTTSGMIGRSVWTDQKGNQAFSEIQAKEVGPGRRVEGRFIGGTGRYTGVSGEYSFTWHYLTNSQEGEVSGRIDDLQGWARLQPANGGSTP